MKVAQIIPCLGGKSGGPSRSVYTITKGLREINCEAEIVTNNYLFNPNIAFDEWIKKVDVRKIYSFEYNPSFKHLLENSDYDLFHIHSVYNYPVAKATRWARQNSIPYILAPRGSLYRAALNSTSAWKKKLFNKLFLISDLNHAKVVHATCIEEMKQMREIGVKVPIAIIPNAITLPCELPTISSPKNFKVVFLGRINPIKNLDGLLKAWYKSGFASSHNAELIIIGDANLDKEKDYLYNLHAIERSLGINNIKWAGAKYGADKDSELHTCSCLILPSHSENFGMVVLEALIQGVPVIASKGTPWEELVSYDCGLWVENSIDEMSQALQYMHDLTIEQRTQMGANGQQMVYDNYAMEKVCHKLLSLYSWILNGGLKPDFIYE